MACRFVTGYYMHLKKIKDLNCKTCSEAKRAAKRQKGFSYPAEGDDRRFECVREFLLGCPEDKSGPTFPRLPAAIDAFNFYKNSVPWTSGGFNSQPAWYRQIMSTMDGAQGEEIERQQKESRQKIKKKENELLKQQGRR